MSNRLDELIRGVTNVGTVQLIYERLTTVMNHPLSSAADVGRVIADDPGLTARLLRLVNSPIYGFPARIDTVSQAISILGMTQLHDLALGTSFIQLFRNVPGELADMGSFWRHSVACGVCARVLAAQRRESNVERFFLAGLLHDIGRPIIFMNAAGEAKDTLTARAARASSCTRWSTRSSGFITACRFGPARALAAARPAPGGHRLAP